MRKFVVIAVVAAALGCGCGNAGRVEILTGEAMGTSYRIKAVGPVGTVETGIHELLAKLDRELSTWREDSWVTAFNRAPAGTVMEMPATVAELLELSRRYCEATNGRFDPTIGALIRVWGFGAWRMEWRGEPTDERVVAARAASGFHNLRIEGGKITKLHAGLMLDFSAIAKGYAVDRMGALLRAAGRRDFIVEFGGDLLAAGNAPDHRGWIVHGPALKQPLVLQDEAIATSGSEHDFRGARSHIIDPQRGVPLEVGPPFSATAKTCAEADALATAGLVGAGK